MELPAYFNLQDKVAIITGGASGIGRGIAEGLADAGADIVIAARRLKRCEQACQSIAARTGVKTLPVRCDISDSVQIDKLVNRVMAQFGQIDILVNNSGVGGSEKPILKMDEKDWDFVIDINLKGMFLLSKAVAAKMVECAQGGRIINVASIGGLIGWPNMSAYCASKGGCLQATKVMALEWARYNIRVNAILPGYFETPMNTDFFSSDAGQKVVKSSIPLRRIAQIDEIRGLAILLASEASSFMTGSALVIDGGQTAF